MPWYYFELRDSDGNDCRVYDCVLEAENADAAYGVLAESFPPDDEDDGDGGTYHPCDCEEPIEPEDNPAECTECDAVTINGVPCHEMGCPIQTKYLRALQRFNNWECPGHGGITVSDPKEFATEDEANAECCRYHSTWHVT